MEKQPLVGCIIFIILFLMLQFSIRAQDLQTLDEDNGYRIFQIGTKLEKLQDSLQPLNLNNSTTTAYKFIGSDTSFQNIAGVRPFVIHVLFDFSNNLVSLNAYLFLSNNSKNFEKRTDQMFSMLQKYFLDRYGSDFTTSKFDGDNTSSGSAGFIWQTEKVTFSLNMLTGINAEWRRIDVAYTKTGFFKDGD